MHRVVALAGLLAVSAACGADMSKNKAAGAVAAVGVGVAAAAVYRAATDECWAMCRHGQVCDHATGLCEPLEPSAKPPASASASAGSEVDGGAPPAPDPCRGLCFAGERCNVVADVADCVLVDAGASSTP